MNEAVDEYISKTEVAKRMDVSTRTIETWMAAGDLVVERRRGSVGRGSSERLPSGNARFYRSSQMASSARTAPIGALQPARSKSNQPAASTDLSAPLRDEFSMICCA
jgi:hypothetical protein